MEGIDTRRDGGGATRRDGDHTEWDPATQPKRPEASLGELLSEMSSDLSTLLRQEIELAKVEAKDEAKRVGKGAGMFGAAGVSGLLALILVSFAAAWLLDQAMNRALAFVIIGLIWGVAAAILAMSGKKQMKSASPPLPTTTQTIKEDVQWARTLKN
jgi:F0F1-type ATP synthase assembly protein I